MLRFYLDKLQVHRAEQVVFLADGAPWIWDRIESLLADWQVPVYRVLDFYHATDHLVEVAKACKGWNGQTTQNLVAETTAAVAINPAGNIRMQ